MPRRWVQVKDGVVTNGEEILAPNADFQPADDPSCGLVFHELADGDSVPAAGQVLENGAFVAPPPPPPPPPETQDQWDAKRKRLIEAVEREAQTKILEAIAEHVGAPLPALVTKIRAIRAADNVGDPLP